MRKLTIGLLALGLMCGCSKTAGSDEGSVDTTLPDNAFASTMPLDNSANAADSTSSDDLNAAANQAIADVANATSAAESGSQPPSAPFSDGGSTETSDPALSNQL